MPALEAVASGVGYMLYRLVYIQLQFVAGFGFDFVAKPDDKGQITDKAGGKNIWAGIFGRLNYHTQFETGIDTEIAIAICRICDDKIFRPNADNDVVFGRVGKVVVHGKF